MNIYGTIILATLIISYVVSLIADLLNVRTLSAPLPEEFRGVYEEEAYRTSQAYTRVRTRFGILTSTVSLAVTIAFWFAGGFNALDGIVRSWNLPEVWTGVLYIGILLLARAILALPFRLYSTFVIEERFGFNRTTATTFVADLLKGAALAVVLGVPVLAGILALFHVLGAGAWLYGWIGVTLFSLVVQFVAPTWIMPLFNKFTPLAEGELRREILAYAGRIRFPLEGIYVMDGSKRSSKSNAFFTGFGTHKRIALFDTLIAKQTVPELVAVLAHEIGHYKKKHIIQSMIIGIVQTGVMFYLLSIFLGHGGLYEAFFMDERSVYAGLIFFGMLLAPIEVLLSIAMQMFSRKNEFEADRFAVETTQHGEEMIAALKKLSVDNLSHLTPHPFYVFLNYSHPPVVQRIRAIREIGVQREVVL